MLALLVNIEIHITVLCLPVLIFVVIFIIVNSKMSYYLSLIPYFMTLIREACFFEYFFSSPNEKKKNERLNSNVRMVFKHFVQ